MYIIQYTSTTEKAVRKYLYVYLPTSGLSEVIGMIVWTVLRKIVSDNKTVTPERKDGQSSQTATSCQYLENILRLSKGCFAAGRKKLRSSVK